jgi:anhydro-N-acetylmuramic acid kinase
MKPRQKMLAMRKISLGLDAAAPHQAIGLMSGTSHDGISAALVLIDGRKNIEKKAGRIGNGSASSRALDPATKQTFKLIAFETYPYPGKLRARLLEASAGAGVGTKELSQLNFALGASLGKAAVRIAHRGRVPLQRVSFIGSHGHTFYHLPPRSAGRGDIASTLQLGEASIIAAMTGVPVVADFRPMDIALGGEGAPLASLAHVWLFGDRLHGRIVQNLGGIANATYLPPRAGTGDRHVMAFDTGPGVGLIDALVARLTNGRMRMDRDGRMASQGQASENLLGELMRNGYFRRRPPKSTGREEFGPPYLDMVEKRARELGVGGDALVATLTALTARSIADACRRFIMPLGRVDELIASGGGARNPTLMAMIAAELPAVDITTAERLGVNGEAIEAVAFALLAYKFLRGEPGNLPTVTGAKGPAILGKLTLPPMMSRSRQT